MKRLTVAGLALLLAGCASTAGRIRPVQSWSATLEPQHGTRVVAAARANSGMHETAISISMAGAEPGSVHPWHIHVGTCGGAGAAVGEHSAYPPLRADANGRGTATARIRVGLEPGALYHINVHASGADAETVVSCGQLR